MRKPFGVGTWSSEFVSILNNQAKVLAMEQYDSCLREFKEAHEERMVKSYIFAIVFFIAGLLAVAAESPFMAVLLLALAANSNRQSADHIMFAELLNAQRLLAMLVHGQSQRANASLRNGDA